jgi:hypothetical protein
MQPRQQDNAHYQNSYRDPELHVRQNRSQHLEHKPNGSDTTLSK